MSELGKRQGTEPLRLSSPRFRDLAARCETMPVHSGKLQAARGNGLTIECSDPADGLSNRSVQQLLAGGVFFKQYFSGRAGSGHYFHANRAQQVVAPGSIVARSLQQ